MKRCWAKRIKHRPTFKEIIVYLLPHLNPRFEKVSYYFSDGGGHTSDTGRGLGEEEEEEGEDDSSTNSLSCEGAAAPRQSLRGGSDYGYGSPTASGDSASVYDEGIDPSVTMNDVERLGYCPQPGKLYVGDSFGIGDHFNSGPSDFGVEMNDMDQPFIRDSFQEMPRIMSRQPNGPASTLHNSGLIELQPLLSSGRTGAHTESSRPNNVQNSSHPFMPQVIDHPQLYSPLAHPFHNNQHFSPHAPPTTAPSIDLPSSQQSTQNCSPFSLADKDPLRSGPPGQHSFLPQGPSKLEGASNPLRLESSDQLQVGPNITSPKGDATVLAGLPRSFPPPAKSPPVPSAGPLVKPTLRLPTLNQPPSGGFKRVPLFNSQIGRQEYKDNASSNAVSDSSGHQLASPASSLSLVMSHDDLQSETSRTLDSPHPSSIGAIASSSEGSKDSGSHSRVNGLSNGHIPMSASSSNRTTPC
ncbi:tyrosine-protein kinase receptor [Elysia marginata]|uniref:Tyrosine-protein kinase receptor n=1 Tax=Elysia marginata TaxID=1093978 RepID=A0AAV4HUK7_9GAST|nr:tyrosine-protein kinase receptor [Elysia marginata]